MRLQAESTYTSVADIHYTVPYSSVQLLQLLVKGVCLQLRGCARGGFFVSPVTPLVAPYAIPGIMYAVPASTRLAVGTSRCIATLQCVGGPLLVLL